MEHKIIAYFEESKSLFSTLADQTQKRPACGDASCHRQPAIGQKPDGSGTYAMSNKLQAYILFPAKKWNTRYPHGYFAIRKILVDQTQIAR